MLKLLFIFKAGGDGVGVGRGRGGGEERLAIAQETGVKGQRDNHILDEPSGTGWYVFSAHTSIKHV